MEGGVCSDGHVGKKPLAWGAGKGFLQNGTPRQKLPEGGRINQKVHWLERTRWLGRQPKQMAQEIKLEKFKVLLCIWIMEFKVRNSELWGRRSGKCEAESVIFPQEFGFILGALEHFKQEKHDHCCSSEILFCLWSENWIESGKQACSRSIKSSSKSRWNIQAFPALETEYRITPPIYVKVDP